MPVICFGLDMHSTPSIQYLQWVCEDFVGSQKWCFGLWVK
jgi:hypothetical protein